MRTIIGDEPIKLYIEGDRDAVGSVLFQIEENDVPLAHITLTEERVRIVIRELERLVSRPKSSA